jgi:3-keto-disaccharide hydrolase
MAGTKVTFDDTNVLPKGWESGVTGKGVAKWEVIADDTTSSKPNVLKQSGEATFCWAAKTDEHIKDGFVEVQFKPISGREDQAGGIVFRFKDANNYYIVRANALEDNVVLYKTVNGKRSSLPVKGRTFGYGVDTKVPARKWSTLRVEYHGNLFTVFLNRKKLFEVEDDTLQEAGAVGVWTKADSVTLFDDFSFENK